MEWERNGTRRNGTKQNEAERNETKRNETERNETKRSETKRDTKRTETRSKRNKTNETKRNETYWVDSSVENLCPWKALVGLSRRKLNITRNMANSDKRVLPGNHGKKKRGRLKKYPRD